jgi:hypothetical protein
MSARVADVMTTNVVAVRDELTYPPARAAARHEF